MTREERIAHCRKFEGAVNHIYLDSAGVPTVGVGCMIRSPFVPNDYGVWIMGDTQCSFRAVVDDMARVMEYVAAQKAAEPQDKYTAGWFAQFCKTRLTDLSIDKLLSKRIDETEAQLMAAFPTYDTAPEPAQDALFDLAFNLGVAGIRNWPKFRAAFDRGDWLVCTVECEREPGVRAFDARNGWTKAQFRKAAEMAVQS